MDNGITRSWLFVLLTKAAACNRIFPWCFHVCRRKTFREAAAAKAKFNRTLRNVPEISGVRVAKRRDSYAIKVELRQALPETVPIPPFYEGVEIVIEVKSRK
jgi:hypothetical protein